MIVPLEFIKGTMSDGFSNAMFVCANKSSLLSYTLEYLLVSMCLFTYKALAFFEDKFHIHGKTAFLLTIFRNRKRWNRRTVNGM